MQKYRHMPSRVSIAKGTTIQRLGTPMPMPPHRAMGQGRLVVVRTCHFIRLERTPVHSLDHKSIGLWLGKVECFEILALG